MVQVKVRMMGPIKKVCGRAEEEFAFDDGVNVSSVIWSLIKKHGEELERTLIDPVILSPFPNALILLNGVEIHNLLGLATPVGDGDMLVLLSVTHGG